MITYKVAVPMAQVLDARRTCATLKQGIEALRDRLAELEGLDPVQIGKVAWEKAQAQKQKIEEDITQAKAEAIDTIKGLSEVFRNEVIRQEEMKGEELTSEPDYALIRDGLIKDPEQLKLMIDRNQSNFTMLAAIDHYAEDRHWSGFTLISNAPMIKEFGTNWFKMCETAANNPEGMYMFQIQTKGELKRLLKEYGILDAAELPDEEA